MQVQRLHRQKYGPFYLHTSLDGPVPDVTGREEYVSSSVSLPRKTGLTVGWTTQAGGEESCERRGGGNVRFAPSPSNCLTRESDVRVCRACRIVCANQEDVENAVFSAHEVFKAGIWSRAPASQRAGVLSNLARDLEERVPDLAKIETLQTGRAIREMKAQVRLCIHALPGGLDVNGREVAWKAAGMAVRLSVVHSLVVWSSVIVTETTMPPCCERTGPSSRPHRDLCSTTCRECPWVLSRRLQ